MLAASDNFIGGISTMAANMTVRGLSASVLVVAVTLVFAASTPSGASAQTVSAAEDPARGLSIRYADGRVTTRVLGRSGSMWTPLFPLLPSAERPKGIEMPTALDVAHVVDGEGVVVTVSLRYGSPHQRRVLVGTVRVTAEAPVPFSDLTAYGVAPVTFAVVAVPTTLAIPPVVVSASGSLDVRVEPIAPDIPLYRFIIANDSRHALTAIHFEAFHGERRMLSGRRRGERNRPLVQPKSKYEFELRMGSVQKPGAGSPDAWQLLDRVVVTSALWEDGVVEGDTAPAAQEYAIYESRAKQIDRVLPLLQRAVTGTAASLRAEIETLSVESDAGRQQIKDALLSDLGEYEKAGGNRSQGFNDWIAQTIIEYEQWKGRIVGAVR